VKSKFFKYGAGLLAVVGLVTPFAAANAAADPVIVNAAGDAAGGQTKACHARRRAGATRGRVAEIHLAGVPAVQAERGGGLVCQHRLLHLGAVQGRSAVGLVG